MYSASTYLHIYFIRTPDIIEILITFSNRAVITASFMAFFASTVYRKRTILEVEAIPDTTPNNVEEIANLKKERLRSSRPEDPTAMDSSSNYFITVETRRKRCVVPIFIYRTIYFDLASSWEDLKLLFSVQIVKGVIKVDALSHENCHAIVTVFV